MGYIFGLCEDSLPTPYLILMPRAKCACRRSLSRASCSSLPFLFLLPLELFGMLALHELNMQRTDFRQKQKFPIACHDSLHFLQLSFQLLFFLMVMFPMSRVFRFKPRLLFV